MSAREAALAAARRGWAVFPCRPGDKRPAVNRWEERACADPAIVGRCWPSDRHNVGVACGPSRLVVIDLDTAAHGGQLTPEWQGPGMVGGADVLAALAERAGQRWPATYTVRTPSGGTHLYFRAQLRREIRNSAGRVGPMVDVRGAGGYVVGAGSVVGGRAYEEVLGQAPAVLPGWLADLADPPRPEPLEGSAPALAGLAGTRYGEAALRGELERVLTAVPGQRNVTLHRASFAIGQLVAAGALAEARAVDLLCQAGQEVGLPAAEAARTVRSGMSAGARHPRGGAA